MTTTGSRGTGRLPRDIRARERLRAAQQKEAQALAAVCAAQEAFAKACAKRDAVVAAATRAVERAQVAVGDAQIELVKISGIDRTAMLLGVEAVELRRVAGVRGGRRVDG